MSVPNVAIWLFLDAFGIQKLSSFLSRRHPAGVFSPKYLVPPPGNMVVEVIAERGRKDVENIEQLPDPPESFNNHKNSGRFNGVFFVVEYKD